ncbi:MAG: hypothetical protein AEth_01870 [Candidatus Argoarchaeum ethanivorans]|uniref:Uncharacterized protein n=1 Tax=Candidatus Argoarchaeum ethanivorans TaxID=2608793 RepID=A0A8B3S0V7_9EURY|nr:MAG: hypothetical protein AEth_01870 [Candidatus Argoarchaeum ethanivorans]
MEESRYVLVLTAVFLCLFMAGNASATDGTTFPVDDAGVAAYVQVSGSIDLQTTMNNLLPHIADVIEVNPTYFIVNVTNDDKRITHLYVGADGWVIPYYLRTEMVGKVVRWNLTSSQEPTPENVSSMTTLEEVIFKTCAAIGVDYETIRSDIKFYDFEHPDANRMMVVVDMAILHANSFYMAIPSEVTVKESSYSHYYHTGYTQTRIYVNGISISSHYNAGKGALYGNYDLTLDQKNTILLSAGYGTCGVGWVLVYQT